MFCPNRTTVRIIKFPKLILNGPICGHFDEKLILKSPIYGHSDEFSLIAAISKPYRIIHNAVVQRLSCEQFHESFNGKSKFVDWKLKSELI